MGDTSELPRRPTAAESEGVFRAIFEQAAVGVAQVVSKTGAFVRINRRYAEILGYTVAEMEQLTFHEITHSEDLEENLKFMRRLLDGEVREFSVEKRYYHKDGSIVWVNLTVSPMWTAGEEPDFHIAVVNDITDRKQAQQDYQTIFREMLNGFALHEIICNEQGQPVDYRFLAANPAFERLTGLKAEDLVGRTVLEVMPNTEKQWIDTYGRVALSGESVRFEDYSQELEKHYIVTAFQPAPGQFACIFDDITELKHAEAAIQEARSYAENLIQTANAIVVVLDTEGEIRVFNDTAEKITGYTVEELSGKNWFETLAPRDRYPEVWTEFERLRKGGDPRKFENPILTKDGEERYIVWQNSELVHDGQVDGTVSFGLDITERKRAEAALQKTEERYRLAQHLSGVGTWEWNVATDRVFWSDEVLAMWGLAPGEFGGTYDEVARRIHPDDVGRWQANVRACVEEEEEHSIEYRVIWPDGTVRWVAAYGDADRDQNGNVLRIMGVIMDVTERERVEREREELIVRLEAQNAELERFTYTVSHDLKSPLITIKGFIGVLSEELTEAGVEFVQDDLARISKAADKMGNLLEDLLELSRIGRLANPPEDVALGELAGEALAVLRGQIIARGVQVDILPNLPTVYGDSTRIVEVLQNLIDNAVKYMGDEPHPCIEIGARPSEGETICFVCDNGIGIEPRFHEAVFGLFDQLNPKVEGSGIGLALAKRIVEVHGGRIWVESEGEGRGSTFCFTIPTRVELSESAASEFNASG